MGWTFYMRPVGDRKAECDRLFDSTPVGTEGGVRRYEVLKSSLVGSTYYAAVRHTPSDGRAPYVFAAVFLTRNSSRDSHGFGYKDMDESMGPCESKCPVGILDLLSPTDNENALDWRERCRQHAAKTRERAKRVLQPGTVVRYGASQYRLTAAAGSRRGWYCVAVDGIYAGTGYRMRAAQLAKVEIVNQTAGA